MFDVTEISSHLDRPFGADSSHNLGAVLLRYYVAFCLGVFRPRNGIFC